MTLQDFRVMKLQLFWDLFQFGVYQCGMPVHPPNACKWLVKCVEMFHLLTSTLASGLALLAEESGGRKRDGESNSNRGIGMGAVSFFCFTGGVSQVIKHGKGKSRLDGSSP